MRKNEAPDAAVPAIEVDSLRVDYGDFTAVRDISLTVPAGEVFGLVGPNGAGKTSAFRVLSTLMEPTYGEVRMTGVDVLEDQESARRIIGYMPDLAPVPGDLKVWEFLDFHAAAYGIGGKTERRRRVAECLERVAMQDQRGSWCKQLSRGQTQRVVLAKTLLHRPQVLILDEPASGLDPLARRELRLTLQALAAEGATVLISSHILSELAEMCGSLCVMHQGRLLASGTADEVRRKLGNGERSLAASLLDRTREAAAWLASQPGVRDPHTEGERVVFGFSGDDAAQADLVAALVGEGFRLRSLEEKRASFEDILMAVAQQNQH